MQARSALFDVYGDYLRSRGGRAPVAALVRLLAPLDIAAPAVRQAVSRMVRQGWLEAVRLPSGPGYALTDRAASRLDEAGARIYRTRSAEWDGAWHLLVLDHVSSRSTRERLHAGLGFLGYARLNGVTWLAPRPSREVESLLAAEGVRGDAFCARGLGDPAALVRRAWDLDALGAAYSRWLADARALVAGQPTAGASGEAVPAGPTVTPATPPTPASDERTYAIRSQLVHEWRKFLFQDPGLPRSLLPTAWPGDEAAAYFDVQAARLLPAAARFVDSCLAPGGPP